MTTMPADRVHIVVIVGKRIGPELLATALEHSAGRKVLIGVTPLAEWSSVLQVVAASNQTGVTVQPAGEVLARLARGDLATDWLLNLWGELIFDPTVLRGIVSSVNVHPSFLPSGRGSDPIVWTILNQAPAAATLHAVTEMVDEGPIWVQQEVPHDITTKGSELYEKILRKCVSLFEQFWPKIHDGKLQLRPQGPGQPAMRRQQLLGQSLIDLDTEDVGGVAQVIHWVQANDFGEDFAGRIQWRGRIFRVSVVLTEEPQED